MVFEHTKNNFRLLGLLYWDPSRRGKAITLTLNCVILTTLTAFAVSLLYDLIYIAETFNETAENLIYTVTSGLTISWYIYCLCNRAQYAAFFDQLDSIIGKRSENPESNEIYQKIDNKIGMITKWLIQVAVAYDACFNLTAALNSIYKYISSNGDNESFRRPFTTALPFDWKTPFGYFGYVCFGFILLCPCTVFSLVMLVTTFSGSIFLSSLPTDLKESLSELDEDLIIVQHKKLTVREKLNIQNQLIGIIRYYGEARQITTSFSEVNSGVVFMYLVYSLLTFCIMLFQFDMALSAGYYILLLQMTSVVIICASLLYLICHFGDDTSQRLEDVGTAAYDLAWYFLPLEKQKDLSLLIAISNKRIYIEGYGGARCTRAVFMRIINKTISFFMVLREL